MENEAVVIALKLDMNPEKLTGIRNCTHGT